MTMKKINGELSLRHTRWIHRCWISWLFELCQEERPSGPVGSYSFTSTTATTQVFGHIPAMHTATQPIQWSSTIELLQRYLIGLIWAQKRHSCKIDLLIKSSRHRRLHPVTFCSLKWLSQIFSLAAPASLNVLNNFKWVGWSTELFT